ncbi:MAG: DUF2283 domain-containing protein [Elusimicrobiota bacterium]
MEALKILEEHKKIKWDYDEEADVLYISLDKPQPAVSTDIGEGVIVRYDEKKNEVVGITLMGLKERVIRNIGKDIK